MLVAPQRPWRPLTSFVVRLGSTVPPRVASDSLAVPASILSESHVGEQRSLRLARSLPVRGSPYFSRSSSGGRGSGEESRLIGGFIAVEGHFCPNKRPHRVVAFRHSKTNSVPMVTSKG